ncbi:MAG TPA: hypothetical protein VFC31_11015 [Candidatus Limnocylindria bacterium]|nr:hypothetical protein [Candidatus Limnocylindria bacterium]
MEESTRKTLETRVARLEQQIRAFKELHATELGLILDELASLRADLAAMAPPPAAEPSAPQGDPAASSPKRAAWLAEQERKEQERRAPLTRRDLLRGGREPGTPEQG